MLFAKGSQVHFVLADGRRVFAAKSAGMLHDPDGESWPRNSILIAPFDKSDTEVEPNADQRSYYGRGYRTRGGSVDLPPRKLSDWNEVGLASKIFYTRGGNRAPGWYTHPFRAPSMLTGALAIGVVGGLIGLLIGSAYKEMGKGALIGAGAGALAGAATAKIAFPFDPPTTLYRWGNYYRLELPKLSIANDRGFVIP